MSFVEYGVLILSGLAGGLLALIWKTYRKDWIGIILAFAGAFLLGLISTHLLPGIFAGEGSSSAGLFILAGFIIQLLLAQLSQGVEHAHFHTDKSVGDGFYVIFIGLCLHAFIEGLPLAGYKMLDFHAGHNHGDGHNHLLIGIALHKFPAAYVLALLMRLNGFSTLKYWFYIIFFTMMTPTAAWLGSMVQYNMEWTRYMMAFVVGSLLHVATTILFETEQDVHHKVSWKKLLALALGITAALLTL